MITIAYSRRTRDKSKGLLLPAGEIRDISLILGGDLGKNLLSAYEEFMQNRDIQTIEQYIKKAQSDRDITFVVELSRKAEDDVRIQLGRPVEYVISCFNEIAPKEFPYLARRISIFIQTINTVHKGPRIHLALSMPVVLGFQIGQYAGLSRYDIQLYHFEKGGYVEVPSVKRG
jgi:hypothetical protein